MRLTDRHHDILKKALTFGSYRPSNTEQVRACFDLLSIGLLDVDGDTIPSRYSLTRDGEKVAEDMKSLPKSARVYVFATNAA